MSIDTLPIIMDTTITLSGDAAGKAAGPFGSGASKASRPVYVLEDLVVHEVSSVDVPANKRKWTMLKSADGTQDNTAPLIPDGKGGFVTKSPTPTAPAAGEVPAKVAEKTATQPEVQTPAAPTGADATKSGDAAATPAPAQAQAEPAAKDEATKAAELAATEAAAAATLAATKAAEEAAKAAQAQAQTPAPTQAADTEVDLDAETMKALSDAVSLAKAGRKLSSERKTKLRAIVQQLSDLLAEVEDAANKADKAAATTKAEDDKLGQLAQQVETLIAANKSLTATVEELTAAQKGIVQAGAPAAASVPASLTANTGSESTPTNKQAGAVNWSALNSSRRR